MERRGGVVVRREIPDIFGSGGDPVANRKLSEVVVDTLADLHAVDATEVGLDSLGRPDGFLERQVGVSQILLEKPGCRRTSQFDDR